MTEDRLAINLLTDRTCGNCHWRDYKGNCSNSKRSATKITPNGMIEVVRNSLVDTCELWKTNVT
jgi:hypothetical protein